MTVTVNWRWRVKSPAARERVVSAIQDAFSGTGISITAVDGELGALGLPRWTTVIFSADHGDYEILHRDVSLRIEKFGLSDAVEELTPTAPF